MKKLLMVIPLVILLCFTFGCQQGEEVAEEPVVDIEAEKEAVAESLQKLVDAAVSEDMEKLKSLWHPQISWWNYTQEHPVGMDVFCHRLPHSWLSIRQSGPGQSRRLPPLRIISFVTN